MTESKREVRVTRRQAIIVGLGGAAAVILAACGVSPSSSAPAASGAPGSSAPGSSTGPATGTRIRILGDSAVGGSFDPPHLTVRTGDTVTWENASTITHNVSCDPDNPFDVEHRLPDGAEPFNARSVFPGDTFEHTFDVAGDYLYGCTMHDGHVGELTVTG
jgi:plastocyanin